MKMKLLKVGERPLAQNQVILMGNVEDIRAMRAFVGCDIEVTITPVLRFEVGDLVDYSSVLGEAPSVLGVKVTDGPFAIGNTLCWRIEGKGTVADAALQKHTP